MFDPEFKYCPVCEDEYRSDIAKCAECDCLLVSADEMDTMKKSANEQRSDRRGELGPDDELVVIRQGSVAEIKVYKGLLDRAGVASLMAGDESSCGRGCCGGNLDLMARLEDAAVAIGLIEEEIRRTSVIEADHEIQGDVYFDPLAKENTCPACGHKFSGGVVCPDCGLCF